MVLSRWQNQLSPSAQHTTGSLRHTLFALTLSPSVSEPILPSSSFSPFLLLNKTSAAQPGGCIAGTPYTSPCAWPSPFAHTHSPGWSLLSSHLYLVIYCFPPRPNAGVIWLTGVITLIHICPVLLCSYFVPRALRILIPVLQQSHKTGIMIPTFYMRKLSSEKLSKITRADRDGTQIHEWITELTRGYATNFSNEKILNITSH